MRPILQRLERRARARQRRIVGERTQQLIVAALGLVRAREDRIDNPQLAGWADALVRDSLAGVNDSVERRRVLECAHDRSPDRDDSPA